MIIYYDLRRVPVFSSMFERSGVIQQNQFRNMLTMYLMRGKLLRRLPSGLFYSKPRFAGGDDKIIIFDSYTSIRQLEWLRRRYPNNRIIFWYWNKATNGEWIAKIPEGVEVWSYSLSDCRRFGMRHNTQFFFDCLADEARICRQQVLNDPPHALFLGRDKGREEELRALGAELEAAGVTVDLRITPRTPGRYWALHEKLVPYEQTIELVKGADILLDHSADPASGLSLRCMESLFFGKKLVTNNVEVLEADFYDPANIYVRGHDVRTMAEFLATPTVAVDPQVRDAYLLSNWLKRFDCIGEEG